MPGGSPGCASASKKQRSSPYISVAGRIGLVEAGPLFAILNEHGNVRHIFAGHAHRPIAGSWRGIPISVLRGTNHQSALEFSPVKLAVTHEPSAYMQSYSSIQRL